MSAVGVDLISVLEELVFSSDTTRTTECHLIRIEQDENVKILEVYELVLTSASDGVLVQSHNALVTITSSGVEGPWLRDTGVVIATLGAVLTLTLLSAIVIVGICLAMMKMRIKRCGLWHKGPCVYNI